MVASDCPELASSRSTTTPSRRAIASAEMSSVTTAIASRASARRSAPSTSANIAWASDRRAPVASPCDRRCFALEKLFTGTTASVRIQTPPPKLWGHSRRSPSRAPSAERGREFERLLGDAPRVGAGCHQGRGLERRQLRDLLVGDDPVEQLSVRGGDAGGAPGQAGGVH